MLVIKLVKILGNLIYYRDLYDKNFKINSDIEKIIEERKQKQLEEDHNTISKMKHYIENLMTYLEKLARNAKSENPDLIKKEFYNLINNRKSSIINISIGKHSSQNDLKEKGIVIDICEVDNIQNINNNTDLASEDPLSSYTSKENFIEEKKDASFFNQSINQPFLKNLNECREFHEIKDSHIFTMHIPLVIFNVRESMFTNQKQLWISDITTTNYGSSNEFEKIKIKLNDLSKEKKMYFNPIELAFNKQLIESINYFELEEENHIIKEDDSKIQYSVNFNSNNFPFDNSFNSSSKMNLNNVFSQIIYFYEDYEKFKNYYIKSFANRNQNIQKFSSFEIYFEEISAKMFLPPSSRVFNLLCNMNYFSLFFEKANNNRLSILDTESSTSKIKSKRKIMRTFMKKNNKANQKIKISIVKIKFKIYDEISCSNNNFMFFFDLNEIQYYENMENSQDNELKLSILSQLNFNNLNLVFNIPYKVKPLEAKELIIEELPKRDFSQIYDKMSKDENKLLVLNIRNINVKVLKKPHLSIELVIGQMIKLGYLKRNQKTFKLKYLDYSSFELILGIGSTNYFRGEDPDNSYHFTEKESPHKDDQTSNKEDFSHSFIINEEDFKYSLQIILSPNDFKRNTNLVEDSLFSNLSKMIKEIQKMSSLNHESSLKLKMSSIHIDISNSLFNYVFYLSNFIEEKKNLINSKYMDCPDNKISVNKLILDEINLPLDLENRKSINLVLVSHREISNYLY